MGASPSIPAHTGALTPPSYAPPAGTSQPLRLELKLDVNKHGIRTGTGAAATETEPGREGGSGHTALKESRSPDQEPNSGAVESRVARVGGGASAGAGLSHAPPRLLPPPRTAPASQAATRGLFVYKQITSAPPSLPGLWARPLAALLPPPPAPNLPASQWCDLRIGWRPPSRSGYATSFPQRYKMSCTAAAALRPSELEMQLSGSSEATELEAEAAGEVRAM